MIYIYFKVPSKEELIYCQRWMMVPDAMSYNSGYDIDLGGYNKTTGIITKTDEEMLNWYNN